MNIIAIKKEDILSLVKLATFVGLSILVPLLGQQAITGPIVNALLFSSVIILGIPSAILVGLLPSLVALSTGLLPMALAPMVMFIMAANTILILSFWLLNKKNFWLGIISASILKFLFLFSTSSIVLDLILK